MDTRRRCAFDNPRLKENSAFSVGIGAANTTRPMTHPAGTYNHESVGPLYTTMSIAHYRPKYVTVQWLLLFISSISVHN
jgi:hypothetical protein